MTTKNKVIVFDLDDTLYKEIEYLKSAYKEIVKSVNRDFSISLDYEELLLLYKKGNNVFDFIISKSSKIMVKYLLDLYRFHIPDIHLENSTFEKLKCLKDKGFKIGIITDGRGMTQRNKLKALNIESIIDEVVISEEFGSEKPNVDNYIHFQKKFPNSKYYYIGDNIRKDFISPNKLGWTTIGIRDNTNSNIHTQNIKVSINYLPKKWVNNVSEIEIL